MFQITRRRAGSALAAIAASAIVLSGCSGSPASSSTDAQGLVTDPDEISGSITFASWWAYANQEVIDGFTEMYPNVDVELQFTAVDTYPTKIQSQASSGDLPDVFGAQTTTLSGLVDSGQLLDLNEALATAPLDGDAETWGESFIPSLLSGANAGLEAPNDETWGVPFNAISVVSVYNQDAYDAAGIEPPATFDELLSNCEALQAEGYIPFSLTGKVWAAFWASFAWDQTMRGQDAADFSVDDPAFVEAYDKIQQMAEAGCWDKTQISTDIDGETSLFLQQKTAAFLTVPENFLKTVADGATFELGAFPVPPMAGEEPNRTMGGGNANVIVVNKNSDNISAAVAFAKYLTSADLQTQLAAEQYTIPSIDIEVSSDDPLMGAYIEAASQGFIDLAEYLPPFTTEGVAILQNEILPGLILGDLTPEQAAQASAPIFQQ